MIRAADDTAWPAFNSAPNRLPRPAVGNPMLLQMFAAVVVGWTKRGGGRRRAAWHGVGAVILMIGVIFSWSSTCLLTTTVAEGSILSLPCSWRIAGGFGEGPEIRHLILTMKERTQGSLLPGAPGENRLLLSGLSRRRRDRRRAPCRSSRAMRRRSLRLCRPILFALWSSWTEPHGHRADSASYFYTKPPSCADYSGRCLALGKDVNITRPRTTFPQCPWTIGFTRILVCRNGEGTQTGADLALLRSRFGPGSSSASQRRGHVLSAFACT